ncbi:hypothetical protein CPB84DRAFT_1837309 [Gymnopilus junonius]|uniref:Uncharacterized protein n=1 Tax=Gymnopilus junonius TaxID=109634 RepID=A0A9P5NHY9_GYMJU|nr:hypothetical protein CPB84DRAFT_1837309 [Gymnopilus junonius]
MYRVFLGAPTAADIDGDPSSYSWRTISSTTGRTLSAKSSERVPAQVERAESLVLPFLPATLEAASHRISLIYKDVIFNDGPEEDSFLSPEEEGKDEQVVSIFRDAEQTTLITWPPTAPEDNESRESFAGPSFLLDKSSKSASELSLPSSQAVETRLFDTQDAESQSFGNYSDASSIARFPSFHFNLHTLASLTHLSASKVKGSKKVNVLLAVLEQVSILNMILGDEEGTVCKLTAWREVAEEWGGAGKAVAAKRGDIVHIENIMAACDPAASTTLTASPYLKSQLFICFRTMPYIHEDGRLRPDLRLGISEPSVRKVAALVAWFEHMAGLKSV